MTVLQHGYRIVGRVFGRPGVAEAIATQARLTATPDEVWQRLMFYEDVPEPPVFLLRAMLPYPVRAEGDKTRSGATVRCVYRTGEITKRITTTDRPHLLQFEVMCQRLGIEDCLLTRGGSYRITANGESSHVVLVTEYDAYLRPRFLWRRVEALLISRLHLHILGGIRTAVHTGTPWQAADGAVTTPAASSGTVS